MAVGKKTLRATELSPFRQRLEIWANEYKMDSRFSSEIVSCVKVNRRSLAKKDDLYEYAMNVRVIKVN